jgi:uncharacterized membrane protein
VKEIPKRYYPLFSAVLLSNGVSIFLFLARMAATNETDYWFMLWNLLLGWIPVGLALLLLDGLRSRTWREPSMVVLSLLWLAFLPNSFYMISDLIHLEQTGDISVLYDAVMLLSFIWNGLLAGCFSLYLVHSALLKRRSPDQAHGIVTGILLLVSFAIYMGRNLRWNSWDVVVNPGGIIYDVSERVINPFSYPQAIATTALFFLLIGSIYLVIRQFVLLVAQKH